MDKKIVEEFMNKLIEHISTMASEAAYHNESNDSCYGMSSWRTEKELRESANKLFEVPIKEEDEDEDEEDYENDE